MHWDLKTICSALLVIVVLFVADRFFVDPPSVLTAPAHAGGVTGVTDQTATLYTASEDGKTIYMWQAYGSKPPKYLGKSEAVLEKEACSGCDRSTLVGGIVAPYPPLC